jgi:hypothetical protein
MCRPVKLLWMIADQREHMPFDIRKGAQKHRDIRLDRLGGLPVEWAAILLETAGGTAKLSKNREGKRPSHLAASCCFVPNVDGLAGYQA